MTINNYWYIFLVFLSWLSVTACQPATTAPDVTQTATATVTPVNLSTLTPTATPSAELERDTVRWWTIERISPEAEGLAGDLLTRHLRSFQRDNPDLELEIILKKESGKGGILDFLRTTQAVAPSVLPDVVVMNAFDLPLAYTEQLITPLDDLLERALVEDLVPVARQIGTIDDQLIGIPLALQMEHLIYNTRTITATPMLWADILTPTNRFYFSAQSLNGNLNDNLLAHYYAAGGQFDDDQGQPVLTEAALTRLLKLYQQAREQQVLSNTILTPLTAEAQWTNYQNGEVNLMQVTVESYLNQRELLVDSSYTGGLQFAEDEAAPPIMRGWVIALVAEDPVRQAKALDLIEDLLSTNHHAQWNARHGTVPIRISALQLLSQNDPYWQFIADQLNYAEPHPTGESYQNVGRAIQAAVESLLREEATPDEAVISAIDALAQ